jgi:hypothetical protein
MPKKLLRCLFQRLHYTISNSILKLVDTNLNIDYTIDVELKTIVKLHVKCVYTICINNGGKKCLITCKHYSPLIVNRII